MTALFGRCFHRHAPFLVTVYTPETLAMRTGDFNIRYFFDHGLKESYGSRCTLKVIERRDVVSLRFTFGNMRDSKKRKMTRKKVIERTGW